MVLFKALTSIGIWIKPTRLILHSVKLQENWQDCILIRLHILRYIIWIHALLAQLPICGCAYFSSPLVHWRWQNSHVHLRTCTDAPWVAQRRSVRSSPALLAAPLSDGGSRCQGSWIAVSIVAWTHLSTWIQASLQRKANESVGHLHWTTWWLPLVVLGSLFKTFFCKVIIVGALLSDNIILFGKTNILESLTYKVGQWWKVFHERKEILGLKLCLIGRNVVIFRWPCCVPSIWHFKRT